MERPDNPKQGQKFIVKQEHSVFKIGTVLVLCNDDGTSCPWFCKPEKYAPGKHRNCKDYSFQPVHWERLEPYKEFKVGDRVRVIAERLEPSLIGKSGTVVDVSTYKYSSANYDIRFDEKHGVPEAENAVDEYTYTFFESELVEEPATAALLTLKEMPNTVVHVKTQEEYDELMQIYEDAGWMWRNDRKPFDERENNWGKYKEETAVESKNKFSFGTKCCFIKNRIISLDEFKRAQGLKSKTTTEDGDLARGQSWRGAYIDEIADFIGIPVIDCPPERVLLGATTSQRFYGYEPKQKRKGVMQQLTARLKRALNKDLQAIYKMGWIDGDLEITSEGANALLELLLDLHEKELGEKAKELIKEQEDK